MLPLLSLQSGLLHQSGNAIYATALARCTQVVLDMWAAIDPVAQLEAFPGQSREADVCPRTHAWRSAESFAKSRYARPGATDTWPESARHCAAALSRRISLQVLCEVAERFFWNVALHRDPP